MAAFSDPEVMAALQDGTCLVSHTNLVMLVTVHVQLPVFCVQVRLSCSGQFLCYRGNPNVIYTSVSFMASEWMDSASEGSASQC